MSTTTDLNKSVISRKAALNVGLFLAIFVHLFLNIYAWVTADAFLTKALPTAGVLTAVSLWVLFRQFKDKH